MKLDRENAALTAAGQQPKQKKFETVKDTLRKQISSVLYRATSFEDFSDSSCSSMVLPSRKAVVSELSARWQNEVYPSEISR